MVERGRRHSVAVRTSLAAAAFYAEAVPVYCRVMVDGHTQTVVLLERRAAEPLLRNAYVTHSD